MNKTIVININGSIFHIEEDAYEILKNYMNDIKRYFANYQDNLEIVSDIENRIAEMLSGILKTENKDAINTADVQIVTAQMGYTKDFVEEETAFDVEDKAEFALNKRLYRDMDSRIIGGVAAGIGYYLSIEAKWIRILFLLLVLIFGVGLIPYILLWIVVPKAATRTEKMAMKGEKINLQNFQRNFEEELGSIKQNLSKAQANAVPGLKVLGNFIESAFQRLKIIIHWLLKVLVKFIGAIIIFGVSIALISLFIFLIVMLGYADDANVATIFPINAIYPQFRKIIYISSFLAVFIPLLALFLFSIRVVFNSKSMGKSGSFSLLMVWILSLGLGIFFISKNLSDFKEEASFSETINLNMNKNNEYYLLAGKDRTIQTDTINKNFRGKVILSGSDSDFEMPNKMDIELGVSDSNLPTLTKTYFARGKNLNAALQNAQQIDYYTAQQDSNLVFDYKFGLKNKSLWRSQAVNIKATFPVGSIIYIQNSLAKRFFLNKLYDCVDFENTGFVKIEVKKDGFVCRKTDEALEKQLKYNEENHIMEIVDPELKFN